MPSRAPTNRSDQRNSFSKSPGKSLFTFLDLFIFHPSLIPPLCDADHWSPNCQIWSNDISPPLPPLTRGKSRFLPVSKNTHTVPKTLGFHCHRNLLWISSFKIIPWRKCNILVRSDLRKISWSKMVCASNSKYGWAGFSLDRIFKQRSDPLHHIP